MGANIHRGVLIAGGAGVGKSRLAREAGAQTATRGWAVRHVSGTPAGRSVVMGSFLQWTDAASGSAAPLAQVIDALVRDANGAHLLVIADDIQWTDEMSALVLHQLVVRDLATVILTLRSGEPAPATLMALWKDEHLTRLDLQPLNRSQSDHLIEAALSGRAPRDLLDRLWHLTLGNALFLRHLVEQEVAANRLTRDEGGWRWVSGPVASPSLVDLVRLQIGDVADDLRHVVDVVAVAEPIEWSCLESLAEPDVVTAAAQRGLIEVSPDGATVRTGHPLYSEVRLQECGPRRLRQLRTAVVNAMLAHQAGKSVDPLRLGMLWLESDLPADPEVFAAAAQSASARLDINAAERLARAAFDAHPDAHTRLLLAFIVWLNGDGPEVEKILDKAEIDGPSTGFINAVTLRAANRLFVLRDPQQSRQLLETALRTGSDPEILNTVHTFYAYQSALAGDPQNVRRELDAADFTQYDPYGQVLGWCASVLTAGSTGRLQDACDGAAAGYAVLAAAPDSVHEFGLAEHHTHALLMAGQMSAAASAAAANLGMSADLPGITAGIARGTVGAAALGRGDLPAAVEHLNAAMAEVDGVVDVGSTFYRFRIIHTEALARAGDMTAATSALDATTASRHPAYGCVEPNYLLATAWVAANSGRVDEARKISCEAAELACVNGQWAREVVCLQTAVQFGFTGAGDRLRTLTDVVEGPRVQAAARYAEALAASNGAALEAVSREYERMGDALVAADASAQAAAIHRIAGRRGSALNANTRAQHLARQCGGAASPAMHASRIALPLTQREHEVVLLVARGLSNREIADAMSLSVRTVEGHVYRATVKAGVSGRAELASFIRAGGES